jgi:hypothetical protein
VLAEPVPPEFPSAGSVPGEPRTGDLLDELASDRASGTLVLPRTGERVVVRDGRIVLVESPRSPSLDDLVVGSGHLDAAAWSSFKDLAESPAVPPGMSVFTWERMCRETTLDAAVPVLADDAGEAELQTGILPRWTDSIPALEPDRLVREAGRRKDVLRRLRPVIDPQTVVVKTREESREKIQLTGAQWALLIEVQDGVTPLEVAPRIGHGVTAATLLCYGLLRVGLLRTDGEDGGRLTGPVGTLFL